MQRWEYLVVSLRDGQYTRSLNEYGRDGWELVSVAPDVQPPAVAEPARRAPSLPMPRVLGQLEDAAAMVGRLGGGAPGGAPAPESPPTPLLWVLRRPLADD